MAEGPQVLPHSRIHWEAYNALTGCRVWLEGRAMPLPLSEVYAYACLKAWDEDTIDDFLYVLGHLEDVYFDWARRETERRARAQKRAPRKGR